MRLRLLVITHGTKDYGDRYVVREHRDGIASLQPLDVCASLEEARAMVEGDSPSLVRLPRSEFDDPVIVESWGQRADVDLCLAAQEAFAGANKP